MGSIKIIATFLFLSFLINAAQAQQLHQPTEQEWNELTAIAQSAKNRADGMIKNLQAELEQRKKDAERFPDLRNAPGIMGVLSKEEQFKNVQKRLSYFQNIEKKSSDLLAKLNALPETARTREKYIQFRRLSKEVKAELEEMGIGPGRLGAADNEKIIVSNIEKQAEAAKKYPAEVVPSGTPPQGIHLSWQNYPRIDGSTTAQPLATLITSRLLGLNVAWQSSTVLGFLSSGDEGGERRLQPVIGDTSNSLSSLPFLGHTGLNVTLNHSGTHSAYRNLVIGLSDIILVAREPSPDEKRLAKEKGVSLDVRPIAHDAFVFILHKQNPVTSLTLQQIQGIYQDNLFNWSELGGNKAPIIAFQRERNSGSQETMEALVMKSLRMSAADQMLIGEGMMGPYNQLNNQENGIGYTFYYFTNNKWMHHYIFRFQDPLQPRIAISEMVYPDGSVNQDHCSIFDLLRGIGRRSFSVPPRGARRLALSFAIRASRPIFTSVVFSVTPVISDALARSISSMFKVVLMHTSMHAFGI